MKEIQVRDNTIKMLLMVGTVIMTVGLLMFFDWNNERLDKIEAEQGYSIVEGR